MAVTGIVIPTYNEAENLPFLVDALEGLDGNIHIYVVDDSSPDGTASVASELAVKYGNISLIVRPGKHGLGSALRAGMAKGLEDGCDVLVTMDSDLSHDPGDVPGLARIITAGEAELAQGSRYTKGGDTAGYGLKRRTLSRIANLMYRYFLGTPNEVTNSFRAYSPKAAQTAVTLCRSRGFSFQAEAALMVMSQGLSIKEVPITFTQRAAGRSKMDLSQAAHGLLFFLAAIFLYRLKLGRFSRGGRQ